MPARLKPLHLLLLLPLLWLTVACGDPDDPSPAMEGTPAQETPPFLVPRWIDADDTPLFDDDGIRFRDYNHRMNGIGVVGSLHRSSEMGHAAYDASLTEEPMRSRGQHWIDQVQLLQRVFFDGGAFIPRLDLTPDETGWQILYGTDLRDYPHGVYAYHVHHRADRFSHVGLYDGMTYVPTAFLTQPGTYLLEAHYSNGRFYQDPTQQAHDLQHMSYGMDGLRGHVYAYVRWQKPGGAEDMGQLTQEQLEGWLQHSPDDLAAIARDIAEVLNDAWDADRQMYVMEEGAPTVELETLSALLRGHKVLYETLYMFGNGEEDQARAETLFDQSTEILRAILATAEPYGLPASLTFTEDGAVAATDTMDAEALWTFVNALTGGFSYAREREGTSEFLTRNTPELMDAIGDFTDMALEGALNYGLDANGHLVASLSMETGEVVDDRRGAAPMGMFVTAAANAYRTGTTFARASDWADQEDAVVDRSRALYDTMLAHVELLEEAFVVPPEALLQTAEQP